MVAALDTNADSGLSIQWHMVKEFGSRGEGEELRSKIPIRFDAVFWYCGADPVISGLRLVEDGIEVGKWTKKENTC